ncbi:MAG TPA: universal stress protein [Pyrinomonadaceae bacterium]|nr:universal stress protein [Pyrinomonadaceae bacterium]
MKNEGGFDSVEDRTLNEMSFSRILCPVLLGPASKESLRYAAAFARISRARLFIGHWTGERTARENNERISKNIRQLVEESINVLRSPSDSGKLEWESLVIEGPAPGRAIVATAVKQEIDLIVMSPKRRPLGAMLLGSTAEEVCLTAGCSVLIVHQTDDGTASWTPDIKMRRLLVAYDFSECAELAFRLRRSCCPVLVARVPSLKAESILDSRGRAPD